MADGRVQQGGSCPGWGVLEQRWAQCVSQGLSVEALRSLDLIWPAPGSYPACDRSHTCASRAIVPWTTWTVGCARVNTRRALHPGVLPATQSPSQKPTRGDFSPHPQDPLLFRAVAHTPKCESRLGPSPTGVRTHVALTDLIRRRSEAREAASVTFTNTATESERHSPLTHNRLRSRCLYRTAPVPKTERAFGGPPHRAHTCPLS